MDAVKYLKIKARMCKDNDCDGCDLHHKANMEDCITCGEFEGKFPEEAVAIIEQLEKKYPSKTREIKFLKLFPDASIDENGIDILPCQIEKNYKDSHCISTPCMDCRRKYWFEEVEDEQ